MPWLKGDNILACQVAMPKILAKGMNVRPCSKFYQSKNLFTHYNLTFLKSHSLFVNYAQLFEIKVFNENNGNLDIYKKLFNFEKYSAK